MNETTVTVVGTVCSEVRYSQSADATPVARFQIRHTPRRFDKRTNAWSDGDPDYFSATCWRNLADHVAGSMVVGDPVVATGRLRISRWRRGEENMVTAELEVQAIGHDLRWGTTVYSKAAPPGGARVPAPGRRREEAAVALKKTTALEKAAEVEKVAALEKAAAVVRATGDSETAATETTSTPAEVVRLPAAA